MRILTLCFLMLFSFSFLQAQSEEKMDDSRKGSYFLEAGYNILGGGPGSSGTGITSLGGDNNTLTGIGFEGGRFFTEDFALKFRVSGLTVDDGNASNSASSFGIGGKYYIAGKVPIELMFLSFDDGGNGDNLALTSLVVAYAFSLADNIYLELGIGGLGGDDNAGSLGLLKMSFTMVL